MKNIQNYLAAALLCGIAFTSARAQHPNPTVSYLEIFDTESGTHRVVKEFPFVIEAPNWTPDGKWLVVNSGGRLYRVAPDGSAEPEEIPAGELSQCNNDHVISADGKWIGLSSNAPGSRTYNSFVYMLPFEGGTPRQVTPLGPSYLHGISPNGKTLAYCAFREGDPGADIYTVPMKGGKEKRLTSAPGLDDGPEFSPDGKYIWFNSVRTGRMQVWRMKADGREQTQMSFDEDMNSWFPHVSPDGRKVVYIAYHDYELAPDAHTADLNVQLRMIPAEGGEPMVLTELFGGQGSLNVNSWSPDSRHFAYVSYRLKEEMEAPAKEMGFQMYSARTLIGTPELFARNHPYVLARLAQMGFTSVEPAGFENGLFYGMEPADFRALMDRYGLRILSSHATRPLSGEELSSGDISNALAWWDACIAAHKSAGIPRIVLPWSQPLSSEAELKTMAAYLDAVGRKCREAGIRFGYHSHSHEFRKVGDTTMMDYFIGHTRAENIFFEMDVYWAVMAGMSPAEYMKKYPGRFELIHIKDKYEIGQSGMVGFEAIFNNFGVAGTQEFIVELEEASTPNILKGIRESALFLRNAPYVKASYR